MRNRIFIASLLISSIALHGCFNDLGCVFEFPESKNELRLMEIMYSDNFSEVQVLRSTVFFGEGTDIPNEYKFDRLYYSFDGMTSYFRNGEKGFMNYGGDEKVFEQPLLINHPPFLKYNSSPSRSDFDYQLSSNTSIYHDYEIQYVVNPFSGDTISTTSNFLIEFNHNSDNSDTLQLNEPVFLDSVTYKQNQVFNQFYTPEEEILLVAGATNFYIEYNEEFDFYFGTPTTEQLYLIKLNTDSSMDTLFTVLDDDEPIKRFRPLVYVKKTLLVIGDNTYQFNKTDGSLKFLYNGYDVQNMSIDNESLTFDNGYKYYSFASDKVTNLNDYLDDIKFSIPFKNLVAFQTWSDEDKIFVFDLNTRSMIKTIKTDELPEFTKVVGSSSYRLENPVFTEDGQLIFMYIRQTYLTDVEYEKRCG